MSYQSIPPELNQLANEIIGLAIKVHKALGPGLLESSYKECLFYEVVKAGYFAEKEKPLPLIYETVKLDIGYRIDLLIENKLIVEIKAVDALADIHSAQVLTYLKLSGNRLGLLINFNVTLLKNGIKRLVL
jgi:GxxExxY protein